MSLLNKIKKTINYANQFGGKLNLRQLQWRLLTDKKYSLNQITKIVTSYRLQVTSYDKNNIENNKKIKLAKELVKYHLSKFKNIFMVGLTGSVAAENAKKNEDIDLFIICKKNTMWLTRLLLRIYIRVHNIHHRKFGQKEKPNDFCFNLWMDESNIVVPQKKQNQKNAVDIVMMKVLLNKNNIYKKFINQNDWAKKYVANGYGKLVIRNMKRETRKEKTSIIIKVLNYIAYVGQITYIRLKGPIKFINLTQAFFHK